MPVHLTQITRFEEGGLICLCSAGQGGCAGSRHPRLDSAPVPSWHAMPPGTSFAGALKGHRPPAASVFAECQLKKIEAYGDQWLRTIPPAASRLLQSAVGKQLRQETWGKYVAAEAILKDRNEFFTNPMVSAVAPRCRSQSCIALNLCPSMSQAFSKTLSGKEATPMPMPFAPVVMLPQVPLSSVQSPASAKPMPWVPLASQASCGVTLPPESLSALSVPDERDSFLIERQVCKLCLSA